MLFRNSYKRYNIKLLLFYINDFFFNYFSYYDVILLFNLFLIIYLHFKNIENIYIKKKIIIRFNLHFHNTIL